MTSSDPARVAETHISYVFLLGDRAYKLKKPVRFDFVDLSTREARERICHQEIDLNRRLSPDIYLGVLDIVDGSGRTIDHLVEMRRLPEERRLSTLVTQSADVDACLRQVAHDLAAFHASAATSGEISEAASVDAVKNMWQDNLDGMEPFVGAVLDPQAFERIRTRSHRYLAGRVPLFAARVAEGRSRDGHGDLLAEDIFCLPDGPRILDCIEFDDRLRWGDVLADVAFLAMDLERLGAVDAAERFLRWYREFSGESYPQSLADHYIAYRASVRSKVACLKLDQGDEPSRDRARALLDLTDRRCDLARVRLVLVGGLPGTGKSTLAEAISTGSGWAVLRSDEVRKDIAGVAHGEHGEHAFGEGIYTEDLTARTYDALIERARALLEHGTSVILDASWVRAAHRVAAARIADETSSDLVEVRCEVSAAVAAERMRRRRTDGIDPSDANAAIARAMAASMDPWPHAVVVDTEREPKLVIDDVMSRIAAAGC